ncbi:hypothetical protein L596_011670 [Steinernema carpocapsae]|uniref:Uncharacterized protein n=1 Tax=Steinernema carpocapsae TaxID=34508 RepID=A0A4U5NUR3_STECR|nr:hypothetical protein L596_011670 [Steinernema carpocapsae]
MNYAEQLHSVGKVLAKLDTTLIWIMCIWIIIVIVAVVSRGYFTYAQRGIDEKLRQMKHLQKQLKKHYGKKRRNRKGCSKKSKSKSKPKKRSSKSNLSNTKKQGTMARPEHVAIDMNAGRMVMLDAKPSLPELVGTAKQIEAKESVPLQKKASDIPHLPGSSKSSSVEDIMKYFAPAKIEFPEFKEDSTQKTMSDELTRENLKRNMSFAASTTAISQSPNPVQKTLSSSTSTTKPPSVSPSLIATLRPDKLQKSTSVDASTTKPPSVSPSLIATLCPDELQKKTSVDDTSGSTTSVDSSTTSSVSTSTVPPQPVASSFGSMIEVTPMVTSKTQESKSELK